MCLFRFRSSVKAETAWCRNQRRTRKLPHGSRELRAFGDVAVYVLSDSFAVNVLSDSRLEGVLVSRPAGWLGGATPAGPQVSVPEVERWSGGMDGMSAGQKRQRGSRSVDIFEFSAESQVGEGTYG